MQIKKLDILKMINAEPIARQSLAFRFGNDRRMRLRIEAARKDGSGAFIFNNQDGKGYYKSLKIHDVQGQFYQNMSRITSLVLWTIHLYHYLRSRGVKVEWRLPRP